MQSQRLYTLDVFRGITVAAMILVNNPGSWSHVYPPLLHAEWNGCTPTDLIFPFFLFIVGTSIHFAYRNRKEAGLTQEVFLKILKRSLLIFLVGFLLALVPAFNWPVVRIPGVLQRIAIVFFIASLIYMRSGWLTQIRILVGLLVFYYFLMNWVDVPGVGPPSLEPSENLGAWLDRTVLGNHLWSQSKTWDPEGILSTIPAVGTAILGMLAGRLFHTVKESHLLVSWLFFIGAVLIVVGLAWDMVFPINKSLWTSSYVLYTGGIAFQFLAACYWIIDVNNFRGWSMPFVYYGMNALFVFVMSAVFAKTLVRIKVGGSSLWSLIYTNVYASWLPSKVASLLFAITLILIFYVLLRWMYRKKIFIKL